MSTADQPATAATILDCPGEGNGCRCACHGCKYHCSAHDPTRLWDEPEPTTAARRAALYCIEKPYYGRDQHLARGWLIVLDAIDQGRDPEAALNEFAAAFVANSNNGVPKAVLDGT